MEISITLLITFLIILFLLPELFAWGFWRLGDNASDKKTPLWIHTLYILSLLFLPLTIFASLLYIQS